MPRDRSPLRRRPVATEAEADRRTDVAGIGLAVLGAAAFGTLAILAKLAYRLDADPLPLLAARFAVASVLLALVGALRRRSTGVEARLAVRLILLGAFGYALESSLFFAALEHAPAAVVALVFYSFPVWTAIMAVAIGLEQLRLRLVVALLLATAGIVFIFLTRVGDVTGPLLALGAALSVAIYFIALQVVARGVDPTASALWTSVGASLGTALGTLATGQALPSRAVPLAFGLGVASACAFVAFYAAIARIGSARASVAGTFEPVTTVLLAAIFLGEALSWRIVGGSGLIIAALPLLAWNRRSDPTTHA